MRFDNVAVGGFFEDLPVLAFVLAGVLSVSGTAVWTSGELAEAGQITSLERHATNLVSAAVSVLRGLGTAPDLETVACVNLSGLLDGLTEDLGCIIAVWCVHPFRELVLSCGDIGTSPASVGSDSSYMNVLCGGGVVGVLEVRALVWCD